MKKILLSDCSISLMFVCIMLLFATSCETKNAEVKNTDIMIEGTPIRIYVIDSCEYIGSVFGGNSDKLAHKGNCKFCKKRREAELQDELEALKQNGF